MKRLFWILAIQVLLPFALKSQITLTGKVTDSKTSEPLPGAHIITNRTVGAVVSDAQGNFYVKNLRKGNCEITISYIGFTTSTLNLNLTKDTSINVSLKSNILLGDEIIITALRADDKTPVTYTIINAKELNNTNLGKDIPMLLEMTPSSVATSDAGTGIGYTGFRIRGTDMSGINVTINGMPLNDPESHQVYWVDVPDLATSVNNIQIQRGVGTSTNGGAAFGASVNIQTNSPSDIPYANLSSSYGSFNTLKNSISAGTGLIDGKWAFDGRYSRISSDGYVDRAFSDLTSFYLGGGYFSKNNIVRFRAWSGIEKTYQAWYGIPKDSLATNRTYNPYDYENQIDSYRQDHYTISWTHGIPQKWSFNTAIHYTKGKGYYEEYKTNRSFAAYQLNNVYIGNDTIKKTDLIQQRWLDNDFIGLTFSIAQPEFRKFQLFAGGAVNHYTGDHFGNVIWAKYASNGKINHEWYRGNGNKSDGNIYVKTKLEIINNLFLYGDIQTRAILYEITGVDKDLRDISQNNEFLFFNPKAGSVYRINNNQKVYVSFAVANREPSRKTLTDANPLLPKPKHETLYNVETGYEYKKTKINAGINIYHMQYANQLVMTGEINDVGNPVLANVPESYRQGIELTWGLKIIPELTMSGNAAFSRNKIINFTEYIDDWDNWGQQIVNEVGTTDIAFSPSVIASNNITWEPIKHLNLSFISKYVGKQFIDNTSSDDRSLDSYLINSFSCIYNVKTKLINKIALKLQVINLFDNLYESNAWVYKYYYNGAESSEAGYFPQAGRHFLTGIEINF